MRSENYEYLCSRNEGKSFSLISKSFFVFDFVFDFKKIFKKIGNIPTKQFNNLKMFIILKHYQTLDSYYTTSFICETEKEANVLVTSLNLAETCETVNYVIAHVI